MWKHPYRVAVLTASDLGAKGERTDESGPLICRMLEAEGAQIVHTALMADDEGPLSAQLLAWCEGGEVDLILTTGGTGFSPRDRMPEATLAVADRLVPGIPEAMRAHSMSITPRGMLSRAASGICKQTLIINLPGSPKAVKESLEAVLPALEHALEMLCGRGRDCAKTPG